MMSRRQPAFLPEIEADLAEKLPAALPDRPPLAPPDAELLKRTRGTCPICLRVLDADVAIDGGEVAMFKTCPVHGPARGVIGPSPEFYRATMNHAPIDRMKFKVLVIPATHRCNLACELCFVPKRDRDNLSLDGLKALIDAFPGPVVALSGGEPTLRDDLPEVIRHIRKTGHNAQLFTNAIRLADPSYVDELCEAGLQHVLLSFNGFDDKAYLAINGKALFDVKARALENCVKAGLDIVVSPTIFRDLNEGEVGPLIELCLANAPQVSQLRIRGACRVGKHGVFSPLSSYELFKLVAQALGRSVSDFVQELDRDACHHSAIQFNMLGVFRVGRGAPKFLGWNSGVFLRDKPYEQALEDLEAKARAAAGGFLPKTVFDRQHRTLAINTWGWPDASNLDFTEIWSHGVAHVVDNRVPMNFCEAVLRADTL